MRKTIRLAAVVLLSAAFSGCPFIDRTGGWEFGDIDTTVDVPVFPPNNYWNTDISGFPIHPNSAAYVASIGAGTGLHADFGTVYEGAPIGIPYIMVNGGQRAVNIVFDNEEESDPGPYPVPANAPVEGSRASDGDRHVLVVDRAAMKLYELYAAYPEAGYWRAGSGAVWDLTQVNPARTKYWTSADAAGLPIFPGLARYDEAAAGEITHALRFTANVTQRAFISPASHYASSNTDPNRPPMGLRVRLKAGFDVSGFSAMNQAILRALKKYGLILADNGSDWFISGAPDQRWDDDDLHDLGSVHGDDFEAVYTADIEYPPLP